MNSSHAFFIDLQFGQCNVWGDENGTDEMGNSILGQPIEIHDHGIAVDLRTLQTSIWLFESDGVSLCSHERTSLEQLSWEDARNN